MGRFEKDAKEFVAKCPSCQYVKSEEINIDFVVGFPKTQKQYDSIWVVVNRLNKYAHFLPVKSTYSEECYATIFIDEILCCDAILLSIISDTRTIHI